MHIVKLGGSLYNAPNLNRWLTRLHTLSQQQPLVIVPGGGPFADQVRQAQQQHKFDDRSAHHMAILAMAQFGLLLHGLQPSATIVNIPAAVAATPKLSIWIPDARLLDADIAQNWQITSDSLALWFAQQLPAVQQLTLIKRIRPDTGDLQQLNHKTIIDDGFTGLYQQHPVATQIVSFHDVDPFPNTAITLFL